MGDDRGLSRCDQCGKTVMYGRHLRAEECKPCSKCVEYQLPARYPCIHEMPKLQEGFVIPDPLGAELPVWGFGRLS